MAEQPRKDPDVLRVCRCEDCEHCHFDSPEDDIGHCRDLDIQVSRLWFCADGERRADNE